MVQLAEFVLLDEGKPLQFKELFKKVADTKGLDVEKQMDLLAQFYTDLNMNGRFVTSGKNVWGLKRWHLAKQMDDKGFEQTNQQLVDGSEGDEALDDELLAFEEGEEEFDDFEDLDEDFEDEEFIPN